jgi:hypothetical protein
MNCEDKILLQNFGTSEFEVSFYINNLNHHRGIKAGRIKKS